jgi:hypothetical protein
MSAQEDDSGTIDRRTYLATTGAVAVGMAGLAGCMGSSTGTLETRVSDQPVDIEDFESCVVTIVGMWLGPQGAEAGNEPGNGEAEREYHEYDEPQTADLVELQGDASTLVDERELETGTYEILQRDVDGIEATLEDGSDATVEVPGEAPLTFNKQFDIREDTRTSFTADFTPVQRGGAGGYVLQPVPSEIVVEYDDSE